jgi:hypothetical protein
MRPRTRILACGLVVLGLVLMGAGSAVADSGGGGGSAGNSQYVDPLSGHSSGHSKSKSTTTTASTSSSTPSSGSSSSTLSQSAPSSVSTSTSSTGRTLPFTGLNLWACIGLGLGLLGAGLALRRALARVY